MNIQTPVGRTCANRREAGYLDPELWIACSVLVWMSPVMMMSMTEHMLHADLSDMIWEILLGGVLAGLIAWTGLAAVTGGLIAGIYKRLIGLRTE